MSKPDLSDRPQMPRPLAWMDDPWGVSWRVKNLVTGFRPVRTARFLAAYGRRIRYTQPVFVVGAPRSGTTTVFHLLRASRQLVSLPGEGHDVWRMYHHPRTTGWVSDAVGSGQVGLGERRFVNAYFHARVGNHRFVEKTPENSLRIPYLLELFPDARFISVRRNPCDVISSLINGWRRPDGRFRSYYVPRDLDIRDYPQRRRWCFVLVEGWRDLAASTIPEIAFTQWRQCVEAIARDRSLVPDDRWVDVPIERLQEAPADTLERITAAAGIETERALREQLDTLLRTPPNAASPPAYEKWRADNPEQIMALLDRIGAVATTAGYEVESSAGGFRVL